MIGYKKVRMWTDLCLFFTTAKHHSEFSQPNTAFSTLASSPTMSPPSTSKLQWHRQQLNKLMHDGHIMASAPVRGARPGPESTEGVTAEEDLIVLSATIGKDTAGFHFEKCAEWATSLTYLNKAMQIDAAKGKKLLEKYNTGYLSRIRSDYNVSALSGNLVKGYKSSK